MPKRKKEPSKAPAREEEEEESEEEEEEEEPLTFDDHEEKQASLNVDFGFFDPKPSDFHGMRALLSNAPPVPSSTFDVSGLADVLSEQAAVGSVVKVVALDSEEPAEPDDVLGFLTALSMGAHKEAAFAKEVRQSVTQRCADPKAKSELAALVADASTGLIVSSRMVNLPAALVPSLFDSLMKDVAWAVEHAEPASERAQYKFHRFLLLATCQMASEGGAGAGSSSDGGGGGDGGGGSGKKRKKAAATARAAQLESLEFARTDEEVLAAAAESCTLLNGAGRTRQLALVLTPDAIRAAVPAMHAAMGESG